MDGATAIAAVSLVVSVWVGYRQWRRDGPMVRCEWAWDFDETEDGQRNPDPYLLVKAVNLGRGPTQVSAFGFFDGKKDLGEISFIGKHDEIYGPEFPHTLAGGHLARWACGLGAPKGLEIRPYVVVVDRWRPKKKARKPVGPPPKA